MSGLLQWVVETIPSLVRGARFRPERSEVAAGGAIGEQGGDDPQASSSGVSRSRRQSRRKRRASWSPGGGVGPQLQPAASTDAAAPAKKAKRLRSRPRVAPTPALRLGAAKPKKRKEAGGKAKKAGSRRGAKKQGAKPRRAERYEIYVLPDELLSGPLLASLGPRDICALASTSRRFQSCVRSRQGALRWRQLFLERWGAPAGPGAEQIREEAARLAGGWKNLFKAKHVCEKESRPWVQPCSFEVQAMLNAMASPPSPPKAERGKPRAEEGEGGEGGGEVVVTFVVDGSGSVTEEDFAAVSEFMCQCVETINRRSTEEGQARFAVVQFSNEVRVELSLGPWKTPDFEAMVKCMTRMNGGTNISLALSRVSELVAMPLVENARVDLGYPLHPATGAPEPAPRQLPRHLVCLLTDGRVDSYQAREALRRASQLAQQAPNVTYYAFAVGRCVDMQGLRTLVQTTCAVEGTGDAGEADEQRRLEQVRAMAETRLMGLRTLEDPTW